MALNRESPDAPRRSEPDTWELVKRVQEGDREAGDLLCRRYGPRVARLTSRLFSFGRAGKADTEDVVQSVMREVLSHLDGFEYRSEAAFARWIVSIVESKIKAYRRYWSAQCRSIKREEVRSADDFAAGGTTPSEVLRRKETRELVRKAICDLPERQRRLFIARVILELPWNLVAQAEGITVAAAQMAVSRAKKRLRSRLRNLAEFAGD